MIGVAAFVGVIVVVVVATALVILAVVVVVVVVIVVVVTALVVLAVVVVVAVICFFVIGVAAAPDFVFTFVDLPLLILFCNFMTLPMFLASCGCNKYTSAVAVFSDALGVFVPTCNQGDDDDENNHRSAVYMTIKCCRFACHCFYLCILFVGRQYQIYSNDYRFYGSNCLSFH